MHTYMDLAKELSRLIESMESVPAIPRQDMLRHWQVIIDDSAYVCPELYCDPEKYRGVVSVLENWHFTFAEQLLIFYSITTWTDR